MIIPSEQSNSFHLVDGGGTMITISLIIGFLGLMFGLVAAMFSGIAAIIGALFAAFVGALTKVKEKNQSQSR